MKWRLRCRPCLVAEMDVFIGVGSNLGDPREHIANAIAVLRSSGFDVVAVAPIVESPAMLPEGAPPA